MINNRQEENPFEDPIVAEEWIRSVEGERGMIRDREIYPMLEAWASTQVGLLVEIGSGQGVCSQHLGTFAGRYLGVEPSVPLVCRARELYGESELRRFEVGNSYNLPVSTGLADAAFSVTVWFHLSDLETASKELSRILKQGGEFRIVTTNPASYALWEAMYERVQEEGKLLVGKVHIPINPLSRNTLYRHTLTEMVGALEISGLWVESVTTLGVLPANPNNPLFINLAGKKR